MMMENTTNPDGDRHKKSLVSRLLKGIKKLFKRKNHTFEEAVSELIEEHDHDTSVHQEEKAILQNIITFGDLEASDVMLPRTEIVAINVNTKAAELEKIFLKEGHSRLPVYNETIDNILGFVHLKDFFKVVSTKKPLVLKDIIRELIFVPRSIKITDLLTRMKQSNSHIAIVLDEYGGTDGLVTIEDIFEEIFGDIKDEYEEAEEISLIVQDGKEYIVDAKIRVEALEQRFGIKFKAIHNQYDTFGGFIMTLLGRIPVKGEKISLPSNLEAEVLEADERKVTSFRIRGVAR